MKKTKTTRRLTAIMALLMAMALLAACGGTSDAPAADNTPTPTTAATNDTANTNDTGSDSNGSTDTPDDAGDFDTSRIISAHTREDGSGTRDAFVSITGVGDDMYEDAVVLGSTNEIRQAVSGNEYAIGYVSVGSLNDEVKAVNIDGVTPSNDTILDGSYAIQRPFLVCVTPEVHANNALVNDFIAYMLSPQGQENVGSSYTPISNPGPDYDGDGSMEGELRIGGSTSVEPLMQRMREGYIALNPGVTIDISAEGSGAGINGATEGTVDIGMSSRELRESELENLDPITIALDGVAVIVHPGNPLSNMTIEQVAGIFTGELTRWSEIFG